MSEKTHPMRVPRRVYEGLEAVRRGGAVNMSDYRGVMFHAYHRGHLEAVSWLAEHRDEYLRQSFSRIEPEDK